MVCSRHFCYLCNATFPASTWADHFNTTSCKLFDDAVVDEP
jgi:hypothetical protein